MNNINIYVLNHSKNIPFFGNSQQFRKEYSQKVQKNQLSETNISNLQGLTKLFSNEGLSYNDTLKAAKKNPFMLFHKPETMEYNIKEVVKRFKEFGLTNEKYLKCALNQSVLFSISPNTVEKNINETVKIFEKDGLSTEKYLNCAELNPSIFTLKPQTIKNKIFQIAKKINIPTDEILHLFLKQPYLFACSEKETIKKFEIFKYIEENKYFDQKKSLPDLDEFNKSILRKKYTNSTNTCFMQLLRNKISNNLKKGTKLPHFNLENSLKNFIIFNQNNKIGFTILDGKYADDFIKFATKLSRSVIHKNIFKITTIAK